VFLVCVLLGLLIMTTVLARPSSSSHQQSRLDARTNRPTDYLKCVDQIGPLTPGPIGSRCFADVHSTNQVLGAVGTPCGVSHLLEAAARSHGRAMPLFARVQVEEPTCSQLIGTYEEPDWRKFVFKWRNQLARVQVEEPTCSQSGTYEEPEKRKVVFKWRNRLACVQVEESSCSQSGMYEEVESWMDDSILRQAPRTPPARRTRKQSSKRKLPRKMVRPPPSVRLTVTVEQSTKAIAD